MQGTLTFKLDVVASITDEFQGTEPATLYEMQRDSEDVDITINQGKIMARQ